MRIVRFFLVLPPLRLLFAESGLDLVDILALLERLQRKWLLKMFFPYASAAVLRLLLSIILLLLHFLLLIVQLGLY